MPRIWLLIEISIIIIDSNLHTIHFMVVSWFWITKSFNQLLIIIFMRIARISVNNYQWPQ